MSAGAGTTANGPTALRSAPGSGAGTGAASAAGRLLGRLTVLPALVATAWLLAGLPLLLAGRFTATLMLAVAVPLTVVAVVAGWRWTPDRWRGALPRRDGEKVQTPWWAVAGLLAVAAAFGIQQMIYHSQQIAVIRDPASYLQFAAWIAGHGSLPIPQSRAAFGGAHHVLGFASPAFYQVGSTVVPQFMAGLPMVLAGGFWAGGVTGAIVAAPVLGACAVLTFGGLAARLVGPRWAPLAALVLAVSLPQQFTSRSTYSEPLAQILFLGGLCLVIDALENGGDGTRITAALGGLALGITVLARIDGASDILPVIPYCGLLLIGRRREAAPILGGLVAGAAFGAVDGWVLSRPYLNTIRSSLLPLELGVGAVVIVTAVSVALLRDRGLPRMDGRWLPGAVGALAAAVMISFTVRPYVETSAPASAKTRRLIAGYQRLNHLPIDPRRPYAALSLHWVFWYIGVPAVVFGTFAAAVLVVRCLRGRERTWTLPLMSFVWIILTVLYRPAITPVHPWASRRLVPAVLPGFILLAVWALGWLAGRIRQRGIRRPARAGLLAAGAALLVLPAAITSFGLAIRGGGPLGVRLVADGLAFKTTYSGETGAVGRMCAAIPSGSSVVIVDGRVGRQFSEVVRGMCGDPTALVSRPDRQRVTEAVLGIRRAGRRPVLLAATPAELAPYGGAMRQILNLRTRGDEHTLTVAPRGTTRVTMRVWMSTPAS